MLAFRPAGLMKAASAVTSVTFLFFTWTTIIGFLSAWTEAAPVGHVAHGIWTYGNPYDCSTAYGVIGSACDVSSLAVSSLSAGNPYSSLNKRENSVVLGISSSDPKTSRFINTTMGDDTSEWRKAVLTKLASLWREAVKGGREAGGILRGIWDWIVATVKKYLPPSRSQWRAHNKKVGAHIDILEDRIEDEVETRATEIMSLKGKLNLERKTRAADITDVREKMEIEQAIRASGIAELEEKLRTVAARPGLLSPLNPVQVGAMDSPKALPLPQDEQLAAQVDSARQPEQAVGPVLSEAAESNDTPAPVDKPQVAAVVSPAKTNEQSTSNDNSLQEVFKPSESRFSDNKYPSFAEARGFFKSYLGEGESVPAPAPISGQSQKDAARPGRVKASPEVQALLDSDKQTGPRAGNAPIVKGRVKADPDRLVIPPGSWPIDMTLEEDFIIPKWQREPPEVQAAKDRIANSWEYNSKTKRSVEEPAVVSAPVATRLQRREVPFFSGLMTPVRSAWRWLKGLMDWKKEQDIELGNVEPMLRGHGTRTPTEVHFPAIDPRIPATRSQEAPPQLTLDIGDTSSFWRSHGRSHFGLMLPASRPWFLSPESEEDQYHGTGNNLAADHHRNGFELDRSPALRQGENKPQSQSLVRPNFLRDQDRDLSSPRNRGFEHSVFQDRRERKIQGSRNIWDTSSTTTGSSWLTSMGNSLRGNRNSGPQETAPLFQINTPSESGSETPFDVETALDLDMPQEVLNELERDVHRRLRDNQEDDENSAMVPMDTSSSEWGNMLLRAYGHNDRSSDRWGREFLFGPGVPGQDTSPITLPSQHEPEQSRENMQDDRSTAATGSTRSMFVDRAPKINNESTGENGTPRENQIARENTNPIIPEEQEQDQSREQIRERIQEQIQDARAAIDSVSGTFMDMAMQLGTMENETPMESENQRENPREENRTPGENGSPTYPEIPQEQDQEETPEQIRDARSKVASGLALDTALQVMVETPRENLIEPDLVQGQIQEQVRNTSENSSSESWADGPGWEAFLQRASSGNTISVQEPTQMELSFGTETPTGNEALLDLGDLESTNTGTFESSTAAVGFQGPYPRPNTPGLLASDATFVRGSSDRAINPDEPMDLIDVEEIPLAVPSWAGSLVDDLYHPE